MKYVLTILLLLGLKAQVDAAGSCLRCNEDWYVFGGRRGSGGGANSFLGRTTLIDGTGTAIATTAANFNEPSAGWRTVTELPTSIKNGIGNWWIGAIATATGNTNWRFNELIQRRRTWSNATNDVGPMVIRSSVATLVPSATGMCTGAYGGTMFIGQKYGVVRDFTQLSVRVASWNPGTHSGGIGLVFGHSQVFNAATSYVLTYYAAIFRGRAGGPEVCAGVYKVVGGTVVAIPGQSTTISPIASFNPGRNPADVSTPVSDRQWTRYGVSRSGTTIRLWIDRPTNVILTVTDSTTPAIGAGQVGVMAIGMNTAIYDDFVLLDAPTCTDGIWNGEEEGVDCGGRSQDGACPACPSTETYVHDFGVEGLTGWHQETYCTSGGCRFPIFEAGQIRYTTNCAFDWPGSTGVNVATSGGAWFMIATKWPQARNIDITIQQAPGDNDRQGIVWRYVDSQNYYSMEMRSEVRAEGFPIAVFRRRNGVTTVLWTQVTMDPNPHDERIVQYFRATMIGNVINIFSNRDGQSSPATLIATIVDTDPLDMAGYVGFNGNYQSPAVTQRFTYVISRAAATLPILPGSLNTLSAPAQRALGFYGDPATELASPMGSFANFRGLSVQGVDLAGSPLFVGSAILPGVEENISPAGAGVVFTGGQFLWSSSRILGDPALSGMTVVMALTLRAAQASGTAGVIMGKGLRERPYNPEASGWRLQLVNTANRPLPTGTSTQALQFIALTGNNGTVDGVADVATGVAIDNTIIVISIRVRPDGVTTGPLDARTFTVDALLNNAAFTDVADNTFTGIVSSSIDGLLSLGATDNMLDGVSMAVFETMVFNGALSDADFGIVNGYMMNKYVNVPANCPDISIPPRAPPNAIVTAGVCTSAAVNGDSCSMGCAVGSTQTAGTGNLVCRFGRWVGSYPRCENLCPTLTAPGTGINTCRSTIAIDSWHLPGVIGESAPLGQFRHWTLRPAGTHWAINTLGVLTVTQPPGHRFTTPLLALSNEPVYASQSTPLAVTQRMMVPNNPPSPTFVLLVPRFRSIRDHYRIEVTWDGTNPGGQMLVFRRVRNGASAALCTVPVTLATGSAQAFMTTMQLTSGGAGSVRVTRNGVLWCTATESAANYISSGTAGYGVQAMAGFSPFNFMSHSVERLDTPCTMGCAGVVGNGTCVLPCNPGTVPRGDTTRFCSENGTFTGTPLVCDNGAPAISDVSVTIAENMPVGTDVGVPFPSRLLSGRDGAGTIVFELNAGNVGNAFTIDSCTGQVRVATPASVDFEQFNPNSRNSFNLRVRAYVAGSDPIAESFANMTVTVTDTNDAPVLTTTSCTVNENAAMGSPVCSLAVVDNDVGATASATFAFAFEEVPSLFVLDPSTGRITVGDTARFGSLDFEAKSSYRVQVRVSDRLVPTLSSVGTVVINVLDVAEAPVVRPDCALPVDAAVMATSGVSVPNFNAISACVVDMDAGASVSGLSSTVVSNPLVFVLSTGVAQVIQAKTYPSATPYLRDGRLIVDYGAISLTVTDNTGLIGTGTVNVYVLANVSSVGPVIRDVTVLPITTAAGSGFVGGEYRINTNGQDSITFTGDNMLYSASHVITANVTNGVRWWTVTCRYAYSGALSGSLPLADGITCPTATGWGRSWQWTVSLNTGSGANPVLSSVALVTHYAPPIVTAIGPPGQPGQPMNYPTVGGTNIQISGHNFGPSTAPVTIDFGIEDTVTQTVSWTSDMVSAIVPAHTTAVGRTRPGAGGNLRVRVTVGGQTVIADTGVRMAYLRPVLTTIGRIGSGNPNGVVPPIGGVVLTGQRTLRGGDTINITGTNFGPATTTGLRLLFGLPGVHPDNNLPYSANCFYPVPAASHTNIQCIAPPAASGTYTGYLVVGGQQSNRAANTSASLTIVYHTVHVATVSGPGARLADTRGGQTVLFTGSNFGPKWAYEQGICSSPRAFYGMTNGTNYRGLRYEMTDCAVLDNTGTTMSCRMTEGTGFTPPYWRWTVIACSQPLNPGGHGWTGLLSTIRYAPPIVSFIEIDTSAGNVGGDTRGGTAVTLYGRNFGPTMDLVSVRYFAPVTDTNGVVRQVRFNATGCSKPDPAQMHEKIVCNLAEGAGAALRWEVEVETQLSVMPTSAYLQPVITGVSSTDLSVQPVLASSEGGTVVYISGTSFGPAIAGDSGRSMLQWVRFGPGSADPEFAYTATDVTLLTEHNMIRAVIPPGIGKDLSVQISVADVASLPTTPLPGLSISYANPRVTSLSPSAAPTVGNVFVKVYVTGAGLLDPTAVQSLSLNGQSVPVVARFPTLERVTAARGDLSLLTQEERDTTQHYLTMKVPEGVGAGLAVAVSAYRIGQPTSTVSSDPQLDGSPAWLSYEMPSITLVSADRLTVDMEQNYTAELPPEQVNDLASWRVLTILGSNLGPDATFSFIELQEVDASGVPVDGTWQAGAAAVVDTLDWSHTRVTIIARFPSASVRVSVKTVDPMSSTPVFGSGVPQVSNEYTYLDVAPAVLALSGQAVGGYRTEGGQTLTVRARNIGSFASLQVLIGSTPAVFLASDGVTEVPPSSVQSSVIQPQVLAQQGTPPGDMVFDVRVRVPAGQGSGVPVVVVRDNTPGTGSSTINYARPTITSITQLEANPVAASTATLANPLRVPTLGTTVTLTGSNFGLCPTLVFIDTIINCTTSANGFGVESFNHSHVVVTIPPGIGAGRERVPAGYMLSMRVGLPYTEQDATPLVYLAYALPTITSITPVDEATGLPTLGGVSIMVNGSNFGPLSSALPLLTIISGNETLPCTSVVRSTDHPHSTLTCTLPEGAGSGLSVRVQVGDQNVTVRSAFSYDAPVVHAVVNTDDGGARGGTEGGYTVRLEGMNFGPRLAPGSCVFLPYSGVPLHSLVCNGRADSWDEFEISSSLVTSWNHTAIEFTMVAGMGTRTVRISTLGGVQAPMDNTTDATFSYDAPEIESVTPNTVCTDGLDCPGGQAAITVTIRGKNFGYGSTAAQNRARTQSGYRAIPLILPAPGQSGAYPSPFALRVNFFTATRCLSSAVLSDTLDNLGQADVPLQVEACRRDTHGYGVLVHTHDTITFLALPGVGKDRNLSVAIVGPDGVPTNSNPVTFSYSAPTVDNIREDRIPLAAPEVFPAGQPEPYGPLTTFRIDSIPLALIGSNYGPASVEGEMSAEELLTEIRIGATVCDAPRRFANSAGRSQLGCTLGATASTGVPLTSPYMPRVGFRSVSARVAGQTTEATDFKVFQLFCDVNFYGLPGEVCDVCPQGATCEGYVDVARPRPEDTLTYINEDGINVTECMACYRAPRARAGFFNMKGLVNKAGVSESICSPIRTLEGLRTPEQCDYIVACDPPEACLPDNVCADGYTNKEWPFRCGQCADGFFRSAGTCRRCPDNPALNIVFFFLVAVVAIGIGWFLNQKQINIAFLTIGLDYLQVISIFANTRVAWPPQIKELFRILSAFNLNIEIVAPECAFKGISYGQKWGMIMLLPIAVNVLLLLIHGVNVVVLLIKGQSKKRIAGMASPLIAMAQVLMYFLYLYITRSVFDVMTCRSLDPPEYTKTGQLKLYMAGVMEECGIPGGTQEQLLPGAVAALIVYVLGYPAAVGFNLWKNRELVMEDQLLRAKRTGDDRLTNPNALEFRRRFARTYYQFKPDRFLWVLAIILRKFLIAISSLVFNTNQNFQMAAMLLVLFLAYAAQVRYLPYMGPANFDQVLKDHEDAAKAGDPVQAKLAGIIAQVQTKGRKRTYNSNFNAVRKVSVNALAKAVARFFFDYNTVEALLLASALLVSLAGVMFGATEATPNSSFYQQSRDGVMSAVIILVAVSILYWLTVVFVEAWSIVDEQAQQSRATARGRGKGTGKGLDDEEDSNRAAEGRSERAAAALGPVETLTNPMFTSKDGKGKSGAATTGISPDALMAMDMPQGAAWMAVRDAYVEQAEKAAAVAAEVARLKAEVAKARMYAAAVGDPESSGAQGGGDVPPSPRTPGTQKRRAFGPEQAGGVVSPLAAVRGKNVSGLRLKQ